MRPVPGSAAWLLLHELRLAWYGAMKRGAAGRQAPGAGPVALFALTWLGLHGLGWLLAGEVDGAPTRDPRILLAVSVALLTGVTFMLSGAIKASVLALFERGDLDLLLSSPLPPYSIFTVRLAGVAANTAAVYLFFLAPLAHGALLRGQWHWLAIYPVVIGAAVLCACAAMLLTLGLVRWLGARHTRVVAQLIGVLAGAALLIASQLHAYLGRDGRDWQSLVVMPAPGSLVWLPARAVLGEPWPLLALAALAATVFILTAQRTHRFFAHGLQLAASHGNAGASNKARPAPRPRFGRGLSMTVVVKEWRLIARDPHLVSQVLLQVLYLLPLCFIIFRHDDARLPAIGAGLTLLASSLTGALAWIALSAEDAPDLLRLAPASIRAIRRAKLMAAVMPVLALLGLPLLWLIASSPLPGLIVCLTTLGAVLGAGLIVFWCGRPGLRSDFKGRGKGGFVMNMFELLNTLAWGALAWLLPAVALGQLPDAAGLGAGAALLVAILTLGLAWLTRPRT